MTDLPFGIETKNTYAALTPADLQSMGKQAAAAYLCGGTSLNDAIIKLARQHPSISPHQVQRVVEYANQETFSKLFSDNEKYASDKNIEFDVADPGDVLLELNSGAKPHIMTAPPDEYSQGPVKLGHADVEADLELARVFGFDFATPGSEKTAAVMGHVEDGKFVLDRVLEVQKTAGDVADRILASGEQAAHSDHSLLPNNEGTQTGGENIGSGEGRVKSANMGMLPPGEGAQDPAALPAEGVGEGGEGDYHEQMLDMQRQIELAKKRQELQKIQQSTLDQMNPQGQPGAVPAPAPAMPEQGAEAGGMPPDQAAAQGAPPAPPGGAPVEMGGGMPQEQMPAAMAGPATVPPGSEMPKMSSVLTKQAMSYVKSGRPHADLVLNDLSAATSLERIKEAVAGKGDYPMANPYGDLIRLKQKVARLLEDATYAKGKNAELHKEATARFQKAVVQHMYEGGNLGEVAHLMSAVYGEPVSIKTAMASAMEELLRHGIDITKAQANAIQYQMEKGASARVPNLEHPIAQAYSDLLKLSEGNAVLGESWSQLKSQYDQVESVLKEAMTHAATR